MELFLLLGFHSKGVYITDHIVVWRTFNAGLVYFLSSFFKKRLHQWIDRYIFLICFSLFYETVVAILIKARLAPLSTLYLSFKTWGLTQPTLALAP